MRKKLGLVLLIFVGLLTILLGYFYMEVRLPDPEIDLETIQKISVKKLANGHFQASNGDILKKNGHGMWEMHLSGNPLELGYTFGQMAKGLNAEKEKAFIGEIENKVPSRTYLNFLKYLVGWFNRDLDKYIPEPYRLEIFGTSRSMSDDYDFITTKYQRALSYHGAHDIGHALQNMNLVGCTSFGVWGKRSENGKMLIGRNFDFYFGQEFAKDQIIAFYRPDNGYQFMSVTWACFSGVVSGMNEKGLTVTLNSAKSDIPSKGKTPVSLIAREILQHAANISEAFDIAKGFDSYVAETFLIGSKEDGFAVLIEKTPESTVLYDAKSNMIIATNHLQSDSLKKDPLNLEYEAEGVSLARFQRVEELIDSLMPINPIAVAEILRDRKGANGKNIGMGNEMAINQLIAHHAVIFSPEEMMVWVSSPPYQLGYFLAYDLNAIFQQKNTDTSYQATLSVPADSFLLSADYSDYTHFLETKEQLQNAAISGKPITLSEAEAEAFIGQNPLSYLPYYYLGEHYLATENWQKAKVCFEMGLKKDVARTSERDHMTMGLEKSQLELKK